MTVKRKSHNLDSALLNRAKRVLGARTETEAIHEALRSVVIGEEAMSALLAVRGRRIFRKDFEEEMGRELRRK
jgi:Arc/MetJ family transcription regulator